MVDDAEVGDQRVVHVLEKKRGGVESVEGDAIGSKFSFSWLACLLDRWSGWWWAAKGRRKRRRG